MTPFQFRRVTRYLWRRKAGGVMLRGIIVRYESQRLVPKTIRKRGSPGSRAARV